MVSQFESAMAKMATLGQNIHRLADCSDVIPVPKRLSTPNAVIPAGKTKKDIQPAVRCFFSSSRPSYSPSTCLIVPRHSFPRSAYCLWPCYLRCPCVSPRYHLLSKTRQLTSVVAPLPNFLARSLPEDLIFGSTRTLIILIIIALSIYLSIVSIGMYDRTCTSALRHIYSY